MVARTVTRRFFGLGLLGLASLLPSAVSAEEIVDLDWDDLLPMGQDPIPFGLRELLPHDETAMASRQPNSSGIRTDWNGQIVRLSGFIVPLDYKGTGVTAFILVPYVGACVHVPPPPANQLVLVTTEQPYETKGLFEPVTVKGMFGAASTSTQLAEIGYVLSAERITPYRGASS